MFFSELKFLRVLFNIIHNTRQICIISFFNFILRTTISTIFMFNVIHFEFFFVSSNKLPCSKKNEIYI